MLSYINTAVSQSAFRICKCYIIISFIIIFQTALKFPSGLLMQEHLRNEDVIDGDETNPPPRRYSTTQEQDEVDEKIRKFQRSSMSRRSSAMQSPILEEVIARITQSFSSRSEIVSTSK